MVSIVSHEEAQVRNLGECQVDTPLLSRLPIDAFIDEAKDERVCGFEMAGPRSKLYFDPSKTKAAVCTCGGVSPGLNNVVRSLFYELTSNYGIREVVGIQYGFQGLTPEGSEPIVITRKFVSDINSRGGTILGTSRGPQSPSIMADFLAANEIDILFCIGGDGTQKGAHAIVEEIEKKGYSIAVIGIPKTIDNDISFVDTSFGYTTAISEATKALDCAHNEARSQAYGIGLVKVMGRHAGFIAAGATIASQVVNFTLIPEVQFPFDGPEGLVSQIEKKLSKNDHAVVLVAEGAGQHLFDVKTAKRDKSGNTLSEDIGSFLKTALKERLEARGITPCIKYIDPSYIVRSVPANTYDQILCSNMARNAAHAAMAGKTDILIGLKQGTDVHVPILTSANRRKELEVTGPQWTSVLCTTGQPNWQNPIEGSTK